MPGVTPANASSSAGLRCASRALSCGSRSEALRTALVSSDEECEHATRARRSQRMHGAESAVSPRATATATWYAMRDALRSIMERTTKPMLAALSRELPAGRFLYEPIWFGLRCLSFVARGEVDLRSRHGKPLGRYFPEVIDALAALGRDLVLDGELVVVDERGFDFEALLLRTHPAASRVAKLSRDTPATFIAFDLLELDGVVLGAFDDRRRALLATIPEGARLRPTPATDDPRLATQWLDQAGAGIDGVVAKARDGTYQPGKRAWIKVTRARTADCVVAGFRLTRGPAVSSLLLGLWQGDELRHVGVCSQFTGERRRALLHELVPLRVPLEGHPWEHGFNVERSPIGRLPGSAGRWGPKEMARGWNPERPES